MPDERPSYLTSTLSQLAVASVGCYLATAAIVAIIVAWKQADPALILAYIAPMKWAAEVFGASYLATRVNGKGGTNGLAPKTDPQAGAASAPAASAGGGG